MFLLCQIILAERIWTSSTGVNERAGGRRRKLGRSRERGEREMATGREGKPYMRASWSTHVHNDAYVCGLEWRVRVRGCQVRFVNGARVPGHLNLAWLLSLPESSPTIARPASLCLWRSFSWVVAIRDCRISIPLSSSNVEFKTNVLTGFDRTNFVIWFFSLVAQDGNVF